MAMGGSCPILRMRATGFFRCSGRGRNERCGFSWQKETASPVYFWKDDYDMRFPV